MNVFQQFFYYFQENGSYIFAQFIRHFLISIYGVLFAAVVGIPVGIMISRRRKLANWVIRLANIIQTIPSLAMISILIIGLGLGVNVVIVTVFLYSLLPIIKNTYTGMIQVDKNILDVGKGMGMTARQRVTTLCFCYHGRHKKRVSCCHRDNRDRCIRRCWWSWRYHYPRNQCNRWHIDYFSRCIANCINGDCHGLAFRYFGKTARSSQPYITLMLL